MEFTHPLFADLEKTIALKRPYGIILCTARNCENGEKGFPCSTLVSLAHRLPRTVRAIAISSRKQYIPEPFWFSGNVDPKPDARIEVMRLKNRIISAHQYIMAAIEVLQNSGHAAGRHCAEIESARAARTRFSRIGHSAA